MSYVLQRPPCCGSLGQPAYQAGTQHVVEVTEPAELAAQPAPIPWWLWPLGAALAGGAVGVAANAGYIKSAYALGAILAGGTAAAALVARSGSAKPSFVEIEQMSAQWQGSSASLFGEGTSGQYPAPYRLADAQKIADIAIDACKERAKNVGGLNQDAKLHAGRIIQRRDEIYAASVPPAAKVGALVTGVVLPSMAAGLWWNWYRPRTKTRAAQYNSIAAWAAMFYALPVTATVKAQALAPNAWHGMGAYLPDLDDYLVGPSQKLALGADPLITRALLRDVFSYLALWPRTNDSDRSWWVPFEDAAESNVQAWRQRYPDGSTDVAATVEGNFKLVELILWWLNMRVEMEIKVDFDEGMAWLALVVNVVAAVAAGIAPLLSPAVAALLTAAASTFQGLAIAFQRGEITAYELQAMLGAGVALALQEAGIDLGLGDSLAQIQQIVEANT